MVWVFAGIGSGATGGSIAPVTSLGAMGGSCGWRSSRAAAFASVLFEEKLASVFLHLGSSKKWLNLCCAGLLHFGLDSVDVTDPKRNSFLGNGFDLSVAMGEFEGEADIGEWRGNEDGTNGVVVGAAVSSWTDSLPNLSRLRGRCIYKKENATGKAKRICKCRVAYAEPRKPSRN